MIFSGVAVFFLFKVARFPRNRLDVWLYHTLSLRTILGEKYSGPTKNHRKCSVLTTSFGKCREKSGVLGIEVPHTGPYMSMGRYTGIFVHSH